MLDGYVHPDYADIGSMLIRLIPRHEPGGAAVCVYHRGRRVVDIWGGTRDAEGNPWLEHTTAPSFSTTKGVVSTLLHILVDQGKADYDDPVAKHWPAFAAHGKERITIRDVLTHTAGLHRLGGTIESPREMLDWTHMKRVMEEATAAFPPGGRPGYHGLTFGWLAGGLVEAISGRSLQAVLDEELVGPLGLDGMYIGMPHNELWRRAKLIRGNGVIAPPRRTESELGRGVRALVEGAMRHLGMDMDEFRAALAPFDAPVDWNAEETVQAVIPAANGQFTARSLARMYALLAHQGELDGVRLLAPATVRRAAQVQTRRSDRVLFLPMHWRLGYHRVFAAGRSVPEGFGHFGFGGSGGWCDPSRELAVALTVNGGVGTLAGDTRIARLSRAVLRAVERLG